MELITWFIDLILHLDKHLVELLRDYGVWVYLILFAIVGLLMGTFMQYLGSVLGQLAAPT